ncbi:hypothetical protein RIF29_38124 [Crotalaria pallida]|uniref:RNase H type-1 domain-containing protein n=1 Tax=Crotalaria pallida TaxID=3830 RepID=A0AAN9HNM3_CROPI
MRVKRHLSSDPYCSICNAHLETELHCLRDCSMSIQVWSFCGFANLQDFRTMNFFEWLHSHATGPHTRLFITVHWWIWRFRNAMVFEQTNWSLYNIIHRISSMLNEDQFVHIDALQHSQHGTRLVSWQHHFHEYVLNVDGSSLGNPGLAGFGGILRIGGVQRLVCQIDSKETLRLVRCSDLDFHIYACYLHDIRQLLLDSSWSVRLVHTLREVNQCATGLQSLVLQTMSLSSCRMNLLLLCLT